MRWVAVVCLLISCSAAAQQTSGSPEGLRPGSGIAAARTGELPDSPGASQAGQGAKGSVPAQNSVDPCRPPTQPSATGPDVQAAGRGPAPCAVQRRGKYKLFLNSPQLLPLTSRQKGILAIRDVVDPFNLLTIAGNAAFTVGTDAHNAYGPGVKGMGRDLGYSFVQDATGEFIGTYLVCSIARQDPHYHRDPEGTPMQRVVHALRHTIISQHDDGRAMPNYENFIGYPASAEISNLYIPGVHGNGQSTALRVLTGLATDPISSLLAEFLPDFARRVHIRIVFVQQILNQIASGQQI